MSKIKLLLDVVSDLRAVVAILANNLLAFLGFWCISFSWYPYCQR